MNKRRKFIALLGILICVALLMSCKKNDTGEETYELYYVNVQTQALEQEKVQIEGDTTEEKIEKWKNGNLQMDDWGYLLIRNIKM